VTIYRNLEKYELIGPFRKIQKKIMNSLVHSRKFRKNNEPSGPFLEIQKKIMNSLDYSSSSIDLYFGPPTYWNF